MTSNVANRVTALIGSVIHSVSFGKLQTIVNGAIVFKCGIIQNVFDLDSEPNALDGIENVINHSGKLIIPGLIDAHCHAPQV